MDLFLCTYLVFMNFCHFMLDDKGACEHLTRTGDCHKGCIFELWMHICSFYHLNVGNTVMCKHFVLNVEYCKIACHCAALHMYLKLQSIGGFFYAWHCWSNHNIQIPKTFAQAHVETTITANGQMLCLHF